LGVGGEATWYHEQQAGPSVEKTKQFEHTKGVRAQMIVDGENEKRHDKHRLLPRFQQLLQMVSVVLWIDGEGEMGEQLQMRRYSSASLVSWQDLKPRSQG
jgi:hypothetical protein